MRKFRSQSRRRGIHRVGFGASGLKRQPHQRFLEMRKFLLLAAALVLTTATFSYAGDCCGSQPPVAHYSPAVQLQPVPADSIPVGQATACQSGCCPKACNPTCAPVACCPQPDPCCPDACCPDPCCPPKRKCIMARLWECEKRKNAWLKRTFLPRRRDCRDCR